jgi:hypothetical protein
LKRLQDEGYDIEVRGAYVLMRSVPYVTSSKAVAAGTLVSDLTLAGDKTTTPSTHVIYFAGDYPCDQAGAPIEGIRHTTERKELDKDLVIDHSFSSKPPGGYKDYYDKLTTYAAILASPAQTIDRHATPMTFPIVEGVDGESVFKYIDTASSRAEITAVTRRLAIPRVAIVGVGGTGSYVLDLVVKTPVNEIHIFDGDVFSQHNAFRSPGAPSIDELRQKPLKVAYFAEKYAAMRSGIVPHPYHVDATNADELRDMDFIFFCLDGGDAKLGLLDKLDALGVPFVDVGMGLDETDGSLGGILRVTTSTRQKRDHVGARVPGSGLATGDYARNIQVADLNALNAALAVIRWKKHLGFYRDLEHEHHTTYTIDGNILINEERP